MENIFFTKEHYWVSIDNDIVTIGLTNFVLDNMNIINYIELPTIGNVYNKTELIGEINYDDGKTFELYSIFNGEILDINDSLSDNYEQLFSNDKSSNWLYRMYLSSRDELEDELISEDDYEEYLGEI